MDEKKGIHQKIQNSLHCITNFCATVLNKSKTNFETSYKTFENLVGNETDDKMLPVLFQATTDILGF